MSFRSTPHPLHSNVENKSLPSQTHNSHREHLDKLATYSVDQMKFSGAMSGDLSSINYLEERKMCSLEPSAFGKISGCSVNNQDIFKNPQPDFVEKISDRSFSSQLFKSHYGSINNEALQVHRNRITEVRDKLPYTLVPGLELKKGLQLNRIDGLPDELDAKDLYESYCHRKYRNKMFDNSTN